MNNDEVFKLAIDGRATVNEMSSDGAMNICMTEESLFAFANACEKIGMEKAAKICYSRYMGDNNREDAEALRCEADILKAI